MVCYDREMPPIQVGSKFLHSPDNGKAQLIAYGGVLFGRGQGAARVGDNTLRGGIGTLEKDSTKAMPTVAVI